MCGHSLARLIQYKFFTIQLSEFSRSITFLITTFPKPYSYCLINLCRYFQVLLENSGNEIYIMVLSSCANVSSGFWGIMHKWWLTFSFSSFYTKDIIVVSLLTGYSGVVCAVLAIKISMLSFKAMQKFSTIFTNCKM